VGGGTVTDVDQHTRPRRVLGREFGGALLRGFVILAPCERRARRAFDERDAVGLGRGVARDNFRDC
jgi:hypothetical protein